MLSIHRTIPLLQFPASLRPIVAARLYATQAGLGTQPVKKRKRVTALNDDGRVAWGDLSASEKAARTAQQTVNFGMILLGLTLTVCSVAFGLPASMLMLE
jgi:mitochondrial import inner membrane translocase subunit TIM21